MTQKLLSYFVDIGIALISLFLTNVAFAQEKINGIITDKLNSPLPGATVVNENANIATSSDANGSYSITAKNGDVLFFSFVGHNTERIVVENKSTINISLEESATQLDAVVVTGYTTQRVKELSGSVAIVKPEDLTAVPAGQVFFRAALSPINSDRCSLTKSVNVVGFFPDNNS